MHCKQDQNFNNCPCTFIGCRRRGICCLCLKHHRDQNELPACYFSEEAEKTYDRSIENFLADKKKQSEKTKPDKAT